jgi:hypothetical protein
MSAYTPHTSARRTDPGTSHQAAQAAAALSTPQQLWEHYEKMPDGIDRINFAAKHFNVLRDYSATLSAAK